MASSRISKEHAESSTAADLNKKAMHVPQQKKQPEDFFSKLDEAVSNLENLQDDMLVDVPEVTSGSEGIANQSTYAPSKNDDASPRGSLHLKNSKPANPDDDHPPVDEVPVSASESSTGEISPHPNIPPAKSKVTTGGALQNLPSNSQFGPPPSQALDGEGPSHLLPDELRGHLPGVSSNTSSATHQASESASNTSNATLPTPRVAKIPARIGILAQDPWLNALLAIAIAAVISIYPAWEAGRRLHHKIVDPQVTELEDAISRPLAVQDNTLRKPATIAADIRTNYNKIQQRYYFVWFLVLSLIGLPLALIRRKNPLAAELKLN